MRYVRDGLYVEHDSDAIDEMSWFEMKNGGSFGAIAGKHDDIVMTRAIAFLAMHYRFSDRKTPSQLASEAKDVISERKWI